MQSQLQISFEGVKVSPALEEAIRTEAEGLDRYFNGITGCNVTVSSPHRHQRTGRPYAIHIRVHVPGQDLVVTDTDNGDLDHSDPYLAVRDAFHTARRQLEDYVRRLREGVRHHGTETPVG
jgi:ribosome-associated translation inhibitor RaiA